jgi:hypothetical protein
MPYRRTAMVAVALAGVLGAACGDDSDGDAASTSDPATESSADDTDTGASITDDPDVGAALDSVGLETKAFAIKSAMGEDEVDRIEVKGDTMHIYLKGGTFEPTMACMVANGVLSDGEKAVMHLDGETTPCE